MAVTATQGPLSGLPRRLVQDGIVSEGDLLGALEAIKGKGADLVPHLVANRLGDSRQIAIAAAHEFGVPLLDLDAVDLDLDVVRLVDEKLLTKHRVLPLLQRGKRLYVAVADPTNLHALDEIKFQTTLRVEPVVVEQDKLDARVSRAIEAVDTTMSSFDDDDFDLENLEISAGDEELGPEVSSSSPGCKPCQALGGRLASRPLSKSSRLTPFLRAELVVASLPQCFSARRSRGSPNLLT